MTFLNATVALIAQVDKPGLLKGKNMSARTLILGGLLLVAAAQDPAHAQSVAGAYVASGTECKDTFSKNKSGIGFAKGVDIFAPAILIKGKKLYTPLAACSLKKASVNGDVHKLDLECASSISYASVAVYFRRGENGSLIRQADASGRDGDRYEKCPF